MFSASLEQNLFPHITSSSLTCRVMVTHAAQRTVSPLHCLLHSLTWTLHPAKAALFGLLAIFQHCCSQNAWHAWALWIAYTAGGASCLIARLKNSKISDLSKVKLWFILCSDFRQQLDYKLWHILCCMQNINIIRSVFLNWILIFFWLMAVHMCLTS